MVKLSCVLPVPDISHPYWMVDRVGFEKYFLVFSRYFSRSSRLTVPELSLPERTKEYVGLEPLLPAYSVHVLPSRLTVPTEEPSGPTLPFTYVQTMTSMPLPFSQMSYADSQLPLPGLLSLNELVAECSELSAVPIDLLSLA